LCGYHTLMRVWTSYHWSRLLGKRRKGQVSGLQHGHLISLLIRNADAGCPRIGIVHSPRGSCPLQATHDRQQTVRGLLVPDCPPLPKQNALFACRASCLFSHEFTRCTKSSSGIRSAFKKRIKLFAQHFVVFAFHQTQFLPHTKLCITLSSTFPDPC
jgi:hypothetical protein